VLLASTATVSDSTHVDSTATKTLSTPTRELRCTSKVTSRYEAAATPQLKQTYPYCHRARPTSSMDDKAAHTSEETQSPSLVQAISLLLEDNLTTVEAVRTLLEFEIPLLKHFFSDVFNQNTVVQASGAESGTSGGYYLGRPWDGMCHVFPASFRSLTLNPFT
jgi:hypothetical protein